MAHCRVIRLSKTLDVTPIISEIPIVKPNKGYRFTGWDVNPLAALTNNKVCVAQYEKYYLGINDGGFGLQDFFLVKVV